MSSTFKYTGTKNPKANSLRPSRRIRRQDAVIRRASKQKCTCALYDWCYACGI